MTRKKMGKLLKDDSEIATIWLRIFNNGDNIGGRVFFTLDIKPINKDWFTDLLDNSGRTLIRRKGGLHYSPYYKIILDSSEKIENLKKTFNNLENWRYISHHIEFIKNIDEIIYEIMISNL